MTLVCVPIMADTVEEALRDGALAVEHGADLVEYRVDVLFEDRGGERLEDRIGRVVDLVARSGAVCIVTCRPEWEGGDYSGDDDERVALFEALGTGERPPAYIDVEFALWERSANIRQKIKLAVDHPEQKRAVSTRLILSTHDFAGRPDDLTRRVLAMQGVDACSVVKVAYRARSIRDNLELFELLRESAKPMIALGMGEFGLMSRVLAPKFGGFLTFASLRDEAATAPGQPTIEELLGLYRFRSIGRGTRVYGVIGWPVGQSMSPLVHNAGFGAVGFDGVYVPMPVEGSYESLKATIGVLQGLPISGASVTIPHKEHVNRLALEGLSDRRVVLEKAARVIGASNTIAMVSKDDVVTVESGSWVDVQNTDASAILDLCLTRFDPERGRIGHCCVVGAGGVARAAAKMMASVCERVTIANRSVERARDLVESLTPAGTERVCAIQAIGTESLSEVVADLYINCTPVGMVGGPDPEGMAVQVDELGDLPSETVFFDTVYNPVETPMLRAAKARGYRVIDGVEMFVKQAAAQFELWTGETAPVALFDRLVRERLGSASGDGE